MSAQEHTEAAPAKRSRTPLLVLAVVAIIAAGVGIYFYIAGIGHVTTDDAYVDGNLVRLTPQIGGTVTAINADETQFVQQGQLLVQLDPRDNEVALAQARASLGQTVREVAQLFANEHRDAATVSAQQVQFTQASQDLARDQTLVAVHGVSAETLQHDQHTLASARAGLEQAQATLAATRAAISGTTPQDHPRVLQAEASLRNAWLAAARTRVVSPVSGYVVRRAVQLGQQVTPGTEMLAIVPVESMWIDANFKENQLSGLRIGQPVRVSADMYGSHVEYHGKVLGLTPGTGSALAVLPAQNASGNWIKIVQRLPVRIGLDAQELEQHPLFLGLSTNIDVDVHNADGAAISKQAAWPSALSTDVYATQDAGVEDEIRNIVSQNLAQPVAGAQAAATRGAP
ncbi:HlyD family efflux transporter periplasmic adaptor subunit [Nevskia soli]|uniref:HlyD family efflux transporter periplasmic adaptor subunit n=1 Tax=Nevskia soli TaxID=418856 RepID=UPI00068D6C26|nr:HlyD family efflux transporter periplasmic adaptor subunit [Nevskia soli]